MQKPLRKKLIVSNGDFMPEAWTDPIPKIDAIEAKLDDATHGLAALEALIDAVEGKLDANLIGAITTGTYSHPSGLGEQFPAALTFAAAIQEIEIELDLNALAQNMNVKTYSQIDGANYRQVAFKVFPTDFDTGTKSVILVHLQKNSLFRVGLTSAVAEGVAVDIPYRIYRRGR
jgi:hypothetical protein